MTKAPASVTEQYHTYEPWTTVVYGGTTRDKREDYHLRVEIVWTATTIVRSDRMQRCSPPSKKSKILRYFCAPIRTLAATFSGLAVLRPVNYSPLPYLSPTNSQSLSYTNNYSLSPYVSHSPYRFLFLQPSLQLPTDYQQRPGHLQEAHQERLTRTPPRHRPSIVQFSQCHSCSSSAATPRARSVPKKR